MTQPNPHSALITFIVAHPRAIILGTLLLTACFAFGLRHGLPLDVSPLNFVEDGSRERADFEQARRDFGDDQVLILAVVCDDVFAPANLAKLRKLHEQIIRIDGIDESLSLVNVPYARSIADGASLEKLIPAGELSAARLAEIRAAATSDRLYVGNLVACDARAASFNILLKAEVQTDARHAITRQVYELAHGAGFSEVYFAGEPFSQWRGIGALKSDLQLFLPLTLLLITFLLWLCFGSFVAVVLPLLTIGLGLLSLLGVMGWTNARFTVLGLMMPTLMLAVGCSYLIHVINQIGLVYERERTLDATGVIAEALRFIALPVLVSALTIIAGFLSLTFTKIPSVRATALHAAAGAACTMILSLTFVPAVLVLIGRRWPRALAFRAGLSGRMVWLLEHTGRWATAHRTLLFVITALIVAFSLLGIRRIVIDIDYFHFFKPQAETSRGVAEINRRLAGVVTFDLIVEAPQAADIKRPDVLERIARLQAYAENDAGAGDRSIDRTLSVADFVKHLNRAFHNNDPQHYAVPTEAAVIDELFADPDQLQGFLSADGRRARILVRSTLSNSRSMASAIERVEKRAQELFPDLRVFATGTFVLLNRTSDRIAREQVQSVSIALVAIYLMLALLFRSLRVGLTALVPNLIPVLFFFGFMGWRGIELNLTTSLVASMVLGLAVDNAVQFIVRFRRVQREKPELRAAIIESMRLSGRPIIYANVALAATFAVFALSSFIPVASFGLLSAVTIMGCLVEDLVLLPSRLTSPVFRAK